MRKQEAIKRMEQLNMDVNVIQRFQDTGEIMVSMAGYCFPSDSIPGCSEAIQYAKEKSLYPFHVIAGHLEGIGNVFDVLYVSKYVEDWEYDIPEERKDGLYSVYIFSYGTYCEFGSILVKPNYGALIRVM